MTSTGDDHNAGTPAPPPKPARPTVRVAPLRQPVPDERPRAVTAAVALWSACLVVLVATGALLGLDADGLRSRLADVLATDTPDASTTDVESTVTITLVAGAAVAVVVLLVTAAGLLQILGRRAQGRTTLTVMSVIAAAGAVGFWIATSDALESVTRWLPFVVAGLALVASIPLYLPAVGRWLADAPRRH